MDAPRPDAVADPPDALFGDLLDATPAGIALLDRALRFRYVNAALAELHGVPREAHVGRTPREALGDAGADMEAVLARALAGETVAGAELREASGRRVRHLLSARPLRGGDALALIATPAGNAGPLRRGEDRLHALLEAVGWGTWELDVASGALRWSASLGPLYGLPPGQAPASLEEVLARINAEDRPAVQAAVRSTLEHGGTLSLEFRVQTGGGERWLAATGHRVAGPGDEPLALVGLTRDVTDRRRREHAAELLAEASLVMARSLDPHALLQRVADLAVPALADWCAVHLADDEGRLTRVAVTHADAERLALALDIERHTPPDPDAATGAPAVVRTGQSQLHPRIETELIDATVTDREQRRLIAQLSLHSALVVPLSARGRTLGAMTFIHAESGREYDDGDRLLAEDLGRRAGLAIDNARLHEAERTANARLRALQSITDVGLSHLDRDALLGELMARLSQVTGADRAGVLLRRDDELELVAWLGPDGALGRGLRVPIGQGITGRIAASGAPLVVDDVAAAGAVMPQLREPGRAMAGVPLHVAGEVSGVLYVSSADRRFDPEDVRLLELVADRASRAIHQSELYERTRDTAIALQRSLLPVLPPVPALDVSARYLPGQAGTEVGGDWYDLFLLPDGRVAIVVGDVVGRGLHAAAGMGQLRTALRAYAFEADRPAAAVERLDRLVEGPDGVEFATLVLIFLDLEAGLARACSAGHMPPLLVGPEGSAGPADIAAGPPVGVAEAPRVETQLRLDPGATLVLYTDGLVEDRRWGLSEGLARLARAAAPAAGDAGALADRLLDAMSTERTLEDDVALIAVRIGAGLQRTFPAQPAAVPVARKEVTAYAAALGVTEPALSDVALAVSEACTNVVVHAYRGREPGPLHIAARREGTLLRVVVGDEGSGLRPREDSPGVGLGLQIIAQATKQFEVEKAPGGGARLVLRFPLDAAA